MITRRFTRAKRLRTDDIPNTVDREIRARCHTLFRVSRHVAADNCETQTEPHGLEITQPQPDQFTPLAAAGESH